MNEEFLHSYPPLGKFLELLEIFYKVDAGSYTKDAGGEESLDFLFDFDHENNKLNFSKGTESKLVLLREKVADYEKSTARKS